MLTRCNTFSKQCSAITEIVRGSEFQAIQIPNRKGSTAECRPTFQYLAATVK